MQARSRLPAIFAPCICSDLSLACLKTSVDFSMASAVWASLLDLGLLPLPEKPPERPDMGNIPYGKSTKTRRVSNKRINSRFSTANVVSHLLRCTFFRGRVETWHGHLVQIHRELVSKQRLQHRSRPLVLPYQLHHRRVLDRPDAEGLVGVFLVEYGVQINDQRILCFRTLPSWRVRVCACVRVGV